VCDNAALREQAHKEEQKERAKALQQARELARVEEEERQAVRAQHEKRHREEQDFQDFMKFKTRRL